MGLSPSIIYFRRKKMEEKILYFGVGGINEKKKGDVFYYTLDSSDAFSFAKSINEKGGCVKVFACYDKTITKEIENDLNRMIKKYISNLKQNK